ncbi:MAG: LysE family transporter [Candidatus Hodarchaeota archaeon]
MLFSLGITLAVPIGPINLEMLKQTLAQRKGWFLGIITGIGAMSGDFIIAMTAMSLGSAFLEDLIENSSVKFILVLLNVLILSIMAWGAWKTEITEELISNERDIHKIKQMTLVRQYSKGFALVLTSPWSYLWWASFGSYLLSRGFDLSSIPARLTATTFFLTGIFTWVLLYCFSLGWSRKLANVKTLNLITKTSAVAIFLIMIKILVDAFV